MSARAGRLSRGIRWLPFVVGLSLACPSPVGWSSAATVLAQEDGGDPAPADMAPPAADEPMPADDEAPAAEEAMPAAAMAVTLVSDAGCQRHDHHGQRALPA